MPQGLLFCSISPMHCTIYGHHLHPSLFYSVPSFPVPLLPGVYSLHTQERSSGPSKPFQLVFQGRLRIRNPNSSILYRSRIPVRHIAAMRCKCSDRCVMHEPDYCVGQLLRFFPRGPGMHRGSFAMLDLALRWWGGRSRSRFCLILFVSEYFILMYDSLLWGLLRQGYAYIPSFTCRGS